MLKRAMLLMVAAWSSASGQMQPGPVLFSDDFTHDNAANQNLWELNPPFIATLARTFVPGAALNPIYAELSFSSEGMRVAGVSNIRQFIGLTSKRAFSPPYTVHAEVMGIRAFANPFALMLVSEQSPAFLHLYGNLNPTNPAHKIGLQFNNEPVPTLVPGPLEGKWYILTIVVDSRGLATVQVADRTGNIGQTVRVSLGTAPAHVVISQSQVNPRVPGPNIALWRNIMVVRGVTADISALPPLPPDAAPRPAANPQLVQPSIPVGLRALLPPAAIAALSAEPQAESSTVPPRPPFTPHPLPNDSTLPASVPPFHLRGLWRQADSTGVSPVPVRIFENGSQITFAADGPTRNDPFFYGTYTRNPMIAGQMLFKDGAWTESDIFIDNPDHFRAKFPDHPGTEAAFTRIDGIYGNDAVCDAANTSRTQVSYAFRRGFIAYGNKNFGVAACWMAIGTAAGHSPSQAFTALLLYEGNGVPQDYTRAFALVQKPAQDNIAGAELLLGEMYKLGRGTPVDGTKAAYWTDKGNKQREADQVALLNTPNALGITPLQGIGIVAGALQYMDTELGNEIDEGLRHNGCYVAMQHQYCPH